MRDESDQSLLAGFEGLEDALHGMIIFLLGFFLSEVISRWWSLIFDCVGGLADAVGGASVLAASLLDDGAAPEETPSAEPAEGDGREVGRAELRASSLSSRAAAARDCVPKLSARGLLTTGEANALVAASGDGEADARVPWVWMARMWTARLRPTADPALPLALEQCLKGVSRVGRESVPRRPAACAPVPHLLTLMAKFNMLLMALTRGSAIARAPPRARRSRRRRQARSRLRWTSRGCSSSLCCTRGASTSTRCSRTLSAMISSTCRNENPRPRCAPTCTAFIQTRPDAASRQSAEEDDNPGRGHGSEPANAKRGVRVG